jgi:acyl-CoA synthetase (NDP forming)
VWGAALKQSEAIQVADRYELIDTLKRLLYLAPICGDSIVVADGSDEHSVTASDVFVEVGLSVPPLAWQSYDELAPSFSVPTGSYWNPINTAEPVPRDMSAIIRILGQVPLGLAAIPTMVDHLSITLWRRYAKTKGQEFRAIVTTQ